MQQDRSADAARDTSCQHTTRGRAAPVDSAARRAMKVIGLGAPLSVRICFHACEVEVMVDELRALIVAYETAEGDARVGLGDSLPGDQHRRDRLGELRRMLAELERCGGRPVEPLEVLWPAALAVGVLRGALRQAADRLHASLDDLGETATIRSALRVVAACLDTWEAFDAVDNGGLEEVWL